MYVLTDPGCETVGMKEIEQLLGKTAKQVHDILQVECTLEEACTYAYATHVARRVVFPDMSLLGKTFKVIAETDDDTKLETIEEVAAEIKATVNLTNPETTVYAIKRSGEIFTGIDLGGELWKRDWRVMTSRKSLRASMAGAVVQFADVQQGDIVCDPFGDDGTLGIELVLTTHGQSPRSFVQGLPYEKFHKSAATTHDGAQVSVFCQSVHDVKAVRMNSKLAGCDKHFTCTKADIDWIDMKLEDPVNKIVTYFPESGKMLSPKKVTQQIETFFQQAEKVLAPGGTVTAIVAKPEELPEIKYKEKKHDVMMGKKPMTIITWTIERPK